MEKDFEERLKKYAIRYGISEYLPVRYAIPRSSENKFPELRDGNLRDINNLFKKYGIYSIAIVPDNLEMEGIVYELVVGKKELAILRAVRLYMVKERNPEDWIRLSEAFWKERNLMYL